jgi:hypothetical protein
MTEDQDAERNVATWHGKMVVDRDGQKIGKLQDVYVDVETDEPQFAAAKEGFIARDPTLCAAGWDQGCGLRVGSVDGQRPS